MFLIIDSADDADLMLALAKNNKLLDKIIIKAKYRQAEKILPGIEKLLKKARHKLSDIGGVVVCVGPGPFTAIRIGVATANSLGFALGVGVAGIKKDEFKDLDLLVRGIAKRLDKKKLGLATPDYGKQPNITIK